MKKIFMTVLVVVFVVGMMPRSAHDACCGVYPTVEAVNVALECYQVPGAITGSIKGVSSWGTSYYSTSATVQLEIYSPSSVLTVVDATLSNLQEFKDTEPWYATYDFAASYTPTEVGTFTYLVRVGWTSSAGITMFVTSSGSFDVVYCLTPGKVTGGGWIQYGEMKNTFGFNAQSKDGETIKGDVEFQMHQLINLKSTSIGTLYVSGNMAVIVGDCMINGEEGYSFVLIVEDNGEPGDGVDKFTLSWSPTYEGFGAAAGTLSGGNIQIHK